MNNCAKKNLLTYASRDVREAKMAKKGKKVEVFGKEFECMETKPISPQKHKAEHKSHKYSFGLSLSILSAICDFCVLLCAFVVKQVSFFAQSIVVPTTSWKKGIKNLFPFFPFLLPSSQILRLLNVCLTLVICSVSISVRAQTPLPVAKARPVYDQCASLSRASGNASAANDDVAKAIAALKEKDPKAREQAAALLGKSCDARGVEPLHVLLKDEDPMARIAAVEALGRLGDNSSVDPLMEMTFTEKDWRVRMAMVGSMLSFKSGNARAGVLNGIANPQGEDISDINDLYVRCSAILSCNQLQAVTYSRKGILFLRNFLTSKYPTTRQMAEQTLHELKNTRNGASEFRAMLKNDLNPEMRRWAAEWMGKIGFENVSEILAEAAANDPEPKVKQAAATSLSALKNVK